MHEDPFKSRLRDVRHFYELLQVVEQRVAGKRTLAQADASMSLPQRGVYFFFEPGEERTTSGSGLRVVRVGTHAVGRGSQGTLWNRLRTHRGTLRGANPGGGNHRTSVFRLHVGTALIKRDGWPDPVAGQWSGKKNAPKAIRVKEYPLELAVSEHIRGMPFLWIGVDDEPGKESDRAYIERNVIALLSNYRWKNRPIDPPSPDWLGRCAFSVEIPLSGLWNVDHVNREVDPHLLTVLEEHVRQG